MVIAYGDYSKIDELELCLRVHCLQITVLPILKAFFCHTLYTVHVFVWFHAQRVP